jgi:hypothetical protein
VVLALLLVPGGAVASTTPTASPAQLDDGNFTVSLTGQSNESCTETIDNRTAVCSSSVDENGQMTLVLYSTISGQQITLTDAGDFVAGGEVSVREHVSLREGRNRIEWRINDEAEFVGVGISTARTIYSEPIQPLDPGLLPGDPSGSDPFVVGATVLALFSIGMPVGWKVQKRIFGGEEDVA